MHTHVHVGQNLKVCHGGSTCACTCILTQVLFVSFVSFPECLQCKICKNTMHTHTCTWLCHVCQNETNHWIDAVKLLYMYILCICTCACASVLKCQDTCTFTVHAKGSISVVESPNVVHFDVHLTMLTILTLCYQTSSL